MPRSYPHSHLCHGRLVGFSVKQRANEPTYFVYFRDASGNRLERDTKQTAKLRAVDAARMIVEKEYAPVEIQADLASWDDVVVRLKSRLATGGIRRTTIGYYQKLIRCVRRVYPASKGPADITAKQAAALRDTMMTGGKGKKNKPRSAHYVAGLINGLSALWQKWFVEDLKLAADNPWEKVEPPKTDKLPVKTITDGAVEHFFAWVEERFGAWDLPHLLLRTKAQTGCRLMDLCSLRSEQLRDERLIFPADLTKGRKERRVPLLAELYQAIDAIKGRRISGSGILPN